jgi:hypothetical protein
MDDPATEAGPVAITDEATDDERLEAFATTLVQVARAFPVPCTLTVNPPGYTIDDRVRELRDEMEAQSKRKVEQVRQRQRRKNFLHDFYEIAVKT